MFKMKKYINISGLGHSGKTSVTDILKEFDNVHNIDNLFEFDLVRIPGGLSDLKFNVYDHWSPIRADAAIKRFTKVCNRLSDSSTLNLLKKIQSYGTNYEEIFNNRFLIETNIFLEKLIKKKIKKTYWPYSLIEKSTFFLLLFKLSRKLGFEKILFHGHYDYYILDNKNFIKYVHQYLNNLFNTISNKNDFVLLNNTIEPYNGIYNEELFPNLISINVTRDPRDVYASIKFSEQSYIPEFEKKISSIKIKSQILNSNKINDFIAIQRNLYQNLTRQDNKNIINLKFEDIVFDYNKTLSVICNKVGINKKNHVNKGKYFDPEKSKKNIGIWKKYQDLPEIKLIEKELAEYCYQK